MMIALQMMHVGCVRGWSAAPLGSMLRLTLFLERLHTLAASQLLILTEGCLKSQEGQLT